MQLNFSTVSIYIYKQACRVVYGNSLILVINFNKQLLCVYSIDYLSYINLHCCFIYVIMFVLLTVNILIALFISQLTVTMEPQHRKILQRNRTTIIENMAKPTDVNDLLFEEGLFTESMRQEVEVRVND